MGEFFLTLGFTGMGVAAGFALFIIPGYIIAIAWSLSLLLVVDKGKNPVEAISLSNKLTYGNKGAMFLAFFVLAIAACIASAVFFRIPAIGFILVFVVMVMTVFASIGMQAYIYKVLCADIQ